MKIKTIIILGITASFLSSCGYWNKLTKKSNPDDSTNPIVEPEPDPLTLRGELRSFESCDLAKAHIEETLIDQLRQQKNDQVDWINNPRQYDTVSSVEESAPQADSATTGSAEKSGPDTYTTTNNQVAGVEESDFVKNNGTHIFQLTGKYLRIVKSWPAIEASEIATMEFEGNPRDMLLLDNQLIVILNPQLTEEELKARNYYQPYYYGGDMMRAGIQGGSNYNKVVLKVVDIADPSDPKIAESFELEGSYSNVRRINNSVRLILSSQLQTKDPMKYPEIYQGDLDKFEKITRIETAYNENVEIVRNTTIDGYLGNSFSVVGSSESSVLTDNCKNVYAPTAKVQAGLTKVATLNLESKTLSESTLLANTSNIYASKESLYLTTPYYNWRNREQGSDVTYLHKFSIVDQNQAEYLGSGVIEGTIHNQFSMDEYEGNLRVASTVRTISDSQSTTHNKVFVLALEDQELKVIGQTPPLAKDERIYSARFDGTRGFVVTFRNIDPLFTIDLSDPTNPIVTGELKIPGFSTYLHMMDENHLLAVGLEDGKFKVSIFDVSDMANPKEADNLILEGRFWSEASYNHKAFTYYKERNLLAVPVSGYNYDYNGGNWWEHYSSSLKLFNVKADQEITEYGNVDMTNIFTERDTEYNIWYQRAQVSRSIFADNFVYAISDLGIRAVDLDKIDEVESTVKFDCDEKCFESFYYYY